MHSTKTSVTVRHREYIGDITSSATAGAFKLDSFNINPGLPDSFPWLSQFASAFSQYQFKGLVYQFRSMSGNALTSTDTALGTVMLATQYNTNLDDYTSKLQMQNSDMAQSVKPSESILHEIECAKSQTPVDQLYIRNGPVTEGDDERLYDLGRFQIATEGLQGTSVKIGELWATYEIEMYKPRLEPNPGAGATAWFHYGNNYLISTVDAANPFGDTALGVFDDENNLDISLDTVSASGYVYFPDATTAKTYMVQVNWRGDSTAGITSPTFDNLTCTDINMYKGHQYNVASFPGPTSTTSQACLTCFVNVPSAPTDGSHRAISIDIPTAPTNSFVDVFVVLLPYLDPAEYGS